MNNIAIFVSGSGTNAQNIALFFKDSLLARVTLIISDNPDAYALRRAREMGIESIVIPRKEISNGANLVELLAGKNIGFVVLAGFLSLIPSELIAAYPQKIVNIHPALLPGYGGKGMYGDRVHRAVIGNREKESGITIHYVNEEYDEGGIIAQYRVAVAREDTAETLAAKIHQLEYEHYPVVIEKIISGADL